MAQDPNEYYEGVIADLVAKRDAIDATIANLRQLMSGGSPIAIGTTPATTAIASKPIDPANIRDDAFFGLSIAEAGKRYLEMVKRKQTVKEIADALERGGLPHTSHNFVNTVGTMMNRAAGIDPELVRVGRGEWGLAAWYGNRRPKPVEAPKKRKKRKPTQEADSAAPVVRQRRKRADSDAESSEVN
jgi:hypothetical protein